MTTSRHRRAHGPEGNVLVLCCHAPHVVDRATVEEHGPEGLALVDDPAHRSLADTGLRRDALAWPPLLVAREDEGIPHGSLYRGETVPVAPRADGPCLGGLRLDRLG